MVRPYGYFIFTSSAMPDRNWSVAEGFVGWVVVPDGSLCRGKYGEHGTVRAVAPVLGIGLPSAWNMLRFLKLCSPFRYFN